MRRPHLVILAVAVLLVLAGVVVQVSKDRKAGEPRAAQANRAAPEPAAAPRAEKQAPIGRERCRQKCAALHKGFVYRARQNAEAEYCGCL